MNSSRRQKIMQAAEALFSQRRFHEITMEDVAQQAGVGKGTLYRYFHDKDALFFEVAAAGFDALCRLVTSERERSPQFRTCLLRISRSISDFHHHRRQLMHMMQAEERRAMWTRGELRDVWMSKKAQLTSAVSRVLDEGKREGLIRADIPLDVLAVFLLGMLRTRGRDCLAHSGPSVSHEHLVSLFLQGAAARSPESGGTP